MPEEEGTLSSSLSISKRVDVYKGNIFDFEPEGIYHVRFGFFDPSGSARCVCVLEPQHIFSTGIFESMKRWEEYYLTADIEHLRLCGGDIQFTQMVVAVDKDEKKVNRGFFLGERPSAGVYLLYVLDIGQCLEFPAASVFATTELVAETQFTGFPCLLDNLELFRQTNLLSSVMQSIAFRIRPNTPFLIICKGFAGGEEILPIVDVWPYTDASVEPLLDMCPLNMTLAKRCAEQWAMDTKRPLHVFGGTVIKVGKDALLNIHVNGMDDDESPAVYMDAYLEKLKLADLESRHPCLTKAEAEAGKLAKTIYVAEYAPNKCFYRCRIVEVLIGSLNVEFIDYGDMDIVPSWKVFEAAAIDKALALIPPLIWQARLFTVKKVGDVNEALNMFLGLANLEFTICAGLRHGLPLVSITGTGRDGIRYNLSQKLLAAKLALPTG